MSNPISHWSAWVKMVIGHFIPIRAHLSIKDMVKCFLDVEALGKSTNNVTFVTEGHFLMTPPLKMMSLFNDFLSTRIDHKLYYITK